MIRFVSAIFLYFSLSSAMGIGCGLTILLDHSSSMDRHRNDLMVSVNSLLEQIKSDEPKTQVSLYTFHTDVEQHFNKKCVADIAPYTNETYPKMNIGTKFLVALKTVIDDILKDKTNEPHKIYAFTDGYDEDIHKNAIDKNFLQDSMEKAKTQNIDLEVTVLVESEDKATNIVKQLSRHSIPSEKITKSITRVNQESLKNLSTTWSQNFQLFSSEHQTDSGFGSESKY
jgi:uncharacterized protein with von Willebrand factor type A (vWA) domain